MAGHLHLFESVFGKEYAYFGGSVTIALYITYVLFVEKKIHRKWKIYKRIKKEDAEPASLFPDKAPDDIFPDTPPTPPEEKEP